jgi:carboxymethylenebutenolidase
MKSERDFMGKKITLTAADGHKLGAYRADPAGTAEKGVVVIQEIFGVAMPASAVN